MQEGHLVLPPWMEDSLLPYGSECRGHVTGFLSRPQHMEDPQYMARLARKETSHTQPKHPEGGKGHQGTRMWPTGEKGDRAKLVHY